MNTILKDLIYLSTQEKIQLVNDLWDDIYEKSKLLNETISVRTELVEVVTSPSTSSGRTD